MSNSNSPITIKKYANRRLYNTASSAYVTLADLAKMVKTGEDFVVYDAKTNEEITRSVLAQIIFEQEGIEELTRKNLAAFTQALAVFAPFVPGATTPAAPKEAPPASPDLEDLRAQLTEMKRRLDDIAEKN